MSSKAENSRKPPKAANSPEESAAPRGRGGRLNTLFTQIYPAGWQALAFLASDAVALQLFATLARHSDERGIVLASVKDLSAILGKSPGRVYKALATLTGKNDLGIEFIRRRPYGSQTVYAMNPLIVWKDAQEKRSTGIFINGIASGNVSIRASKTGRNTHQIPVLAHFDMAAETAALVDELRLPDADTQAAASARKKTAAAGTA